MNLADALPLALEKLSRATANTRDMERSVGTPSVERLLEHACAAALVSIAHDLHALREVGDRERERAGRREAEAAAVLDRLADRAETRAESPS